MLTNRKSLILALVFAVALSLVLVLVGCSQANTGTDTQGGSPNVGSNTAVLERPASSETVTPLVPKEEGPKIIGIEDILAKPDVYIGQAVVVKGKIISECGSGCWFTLNDGTGIIYVDLKPNNFVIPQKRGATATVYGDVFLKSGDTYIIGKKVEF